MLFGNNEPNSTSCTCRIVSAVLFCGFAVARVVREMGTKDNAITCGDRPQLERGPQVLVTHKDRG